MPETRTQQVAHVLGFLLALSLLHLTFASSPTKNVIVDQFGYRPSSALKYAMVSSAIIGQNAPNLISPGTTFQIKRQSDRAIVFTGNLSSSIDDQSKSGDIVWRADFSFFTMPGSYYIDLPSASVPASSYNFTIGDAIFTPVLAASLKAFFYQRCGVELRAAHGRNWYHAACHVGPNQDLAAPLWANQNLGQPRDISGGWHDAGDYRKYVPFVYSPVWHLLHAYEWFPSKFGDNLGIPESGNGVPDVLDEVAVALRFLLKMQFANGSVAGVVGVLAYSDGSPPNLDTESTYYSQYCTLATSTLAATCALGARLFQPFNATFASTLKAAALKAWAFLKSTPANVRYIANGFSQADANGEDYDDLSRRVAAAAELFALTGEAQYRTFFDTYCNDAGVADEGNYRPLSSEYFDAGSNFPIQMALISYALAPNATSSIVAATRLALRNGAEWFHMDNAPSDPYNAFMWDGHYTWGSTSRKCTWGNILLWAWKLQAGPTPARNAQYLAQAEEYLHYVHGRNPLSWVYLSNMGPRGANAGASKSPMQPYHGWFNDGSSLYDGESSTYGPAPGFVVGGPNQFYSGGVTPPKNEPQMKAFIDFNTGWPDNSWEITEPAIVYQGQYVFLCSAFAGSIPSVPTHKRTPSALPVTPTKTPPTRTKSSSTPTRRTFTATTRRTTVSIVGTATTTKRIPTSTRSHTRSHSPKPAVRIGCSYTIQIGDPWQPTDTQWQADINVLVSAQAGSLQMDIPWVVTVTGNWATVSEPWNMIRVASGPGIVYGTMNEAWQRLVPGGDAIGMGFLGMKAMDTLLAVTAVFVNGVACTPAP